MQQPSCVHLSIMFLGGYFQDIAKKTHKNKADLHAEY